MSSPIFVAKYTPASNDNATTPKTAAVTTQAGDLLVVVCIAETACTFTVSGNSIAFTKTVGSGTTSGRGYIEIWTGTDATGGTGWTLSVAATGGFFYGFVASRWSHAAVGASATQQGITTFAGSLTTGSAHSAVVGAAVDWAAGTGAETWTTINGITPTAANTAEELHFVDASHYGLYTAHWSDVGAAGSKNPFPSAPSPGGFTTASVEITGAAGGTRLYLTNGTAVFMPSTKRGAWNTLATASNGPIDKTPAGTNSNINQSAAAVLVMQRRVGSIAALQAGSTAGATLDLMLGQTHNSGVTSMLSNVYGFVTTGAVDAVRGVLITNTDGGPVTVTPGAGVLSIGLALSTVAVQAGDFIILELGFHTISGSGALNNQLSFGNTGTVDLFSGDTALTVDPSWVQFNGMDWFWTAAVAPTPEALAPKPRFWLPQVIAADRAARW